MEQNLLLTAERLRLSADLQRGWSSGGAFVIKNVPAQVYLAVSQSQARVLEAFGPGATVPEVLDLLLRERRCPPLREFYELVLKAHEAGVLCSGPSRQPPRRSLSWPGWAADVRWVWPFGILQVLTGLLLLWRAPVFAEAWGWAGCLVGSVLAFLSLGLGQLLAAAILAGLGGEVYARRPVDSLALMHLWLDLRDVLLLRPSEQALVALAGKLPLALALLVALISFPTATLSLAGAWVLVWRPWGGGLSRRLLTLVSRQPALSTDTHFLFLPNQGPQAHWRPWWRRWDLRVCAFEVIWAALWTALLARLVVHAFGVGFFEALEADFAYWAWASQGLVAVLLLVALVALGRRWRDAMRQAWDKVRQRWELRARRRRDYVFPDTDAALMRLAVENPLLALISPYDRAAIVRAWRPVTQAARRDLSSEAGNHVGLILSGCIEARRSLPSGRKVRALMLEEGDFFGLPSPLAFGGEEVALEFRSISPVAAMSVPAEIFQRHVIDKLGVLLVYDYTYKLSFLRRLQVCAHWDAATVARFARLAQVAVYPDGEKILREGTETQWFYIVYDGIAQVRRGGKLLARLRAGDFFGEISLLQNGHSVAEVAAQGQVRCLQIDRPSFLRFMTHNHHVALALERISSARLGHPIFPLRTAPIGTATPFMGAVRRGAVAESAA